MEIVSHNMTRTAHRSPTCPATACRDPPMTSITSFWRSHRDATKPAGKSALTMASSMVALPETSGRSVLAEGVSPSTLSIKCSVFVLF